MTEAMQARRARRRVRLVIAALAVATATFVTAEAPSAEPPSMVKLRTPSFPTEAISAFGSIWVGTHRGYTLYRIDPTTGQIVARINLGQDNCWLDAGGGRMWTQGCGTDLTTRPIDPRTNKPGPVLDNSAPYFGGGSMWVTNSANTALLRLDPKTHVLLKSFKLNFDDPTEGGLTGFAYGSVWMGDQAKVIHVDAATNELTIIPLPGSKAFPGPAQGYAAGGEMAFAGGKVWYGNPAGVYEIDPVKNVATLLPISIGTLEEWGSIGFTSGAGSVWARTSDTQVTRIDPLTGAVVGAYPASGGGGGIAVANGALWVINAGLDSVWGEPIP